MFTCTQFESGGLHGLQPAEDFASSVEEDPLTGELLKEMELSSEKKKINDGEVGQAQSSEGSGDFRR